MSLIPDVAVLCARADSDYKTIEGCDVYDIERDARTWPGGCPAVAHPPCRSWGKLRAFAKPRAGERELALWCVEMVRQNGGVLEHPRGSTLWQAAGLPLPGETDRFGGFTLPVDQHWWGHRAAKATWLYVCGCALADIPALPPRPALPPTHVISTPIHKGQPGWRPEVSKKEREATPPALAKWLVEMARRCRSQAPAMAA